MAAVKIVNFLGTAPKISPELLPNTASQVANNCKLYSGDLIPYPQPVVVANTNRTGTIKTLFALRDPDTNELKWLSWLTDVDIAVASANEDGEQRFYYTGDGAPKVSTYALATTGAPPYPISYYDLGYTTGKMAVEILKNGADVSKMKIERIHNYYQQNYKH